MFGNWKKKLRVFCEGLEVQNLDELMSRGKVGDFRRLGEVMTNRINLINSQPHMKKVRDEDCPYKLERKRS